MNVKTRWGGTALDTDWRPPPSGGAVGWCYSNFTLYAQTALANLSAVYPRYDAAAGFAVAGVVWHQGWNDGCSEAAATEYEFNLANLIRDLRTELGEQLLVSIPVQGTDNGWHGAVDRRLEVIRAQYNVSTYLAGVASTETRGFFRDFDETHGAVNQGRAPTHSHTHTPRRQTDVHFSLSQGPAKQTLRIWSSYPSIDDDARAARICCFPRNTQPLGRALRLRLDPTMPCLRPTRSPKRYPIRRLSQVPLEWERALLFFRRHGGGASDAITRRRELDTTLHQYHGHPKDPLRKLLRCLSHLTPSRRALCIFCCCSLS